MEAVRLSLFIIRIVGWSSGGSGAAEREMLTDERGKVQVRRLPTTFVVCCCCLSCTPRVHGGAEVVLKRCRCGADGSVKVVVKAEVVLVLERW